MTRNDLINQLVLKFAGKYPEYQIREMTIALLQEMGDRIAAGDPVELRGFGSFRLRRLNSKSGRNPRTNEVIPLQQRNTIYFRPSKQMREGVIDTIPLEKQ